MNRLTLNTTLQVTTRSLELVSGLLINAWLARNWGSGAFGQLGYFMSLSVICTFLFDFGLSNLLIRTVARAPRQASHVVLNALILVIPQAVLGVAVVFGLGLWQTGGAHAAILAWICLQLALNAALQILRSSYYAFERMEFESVPAIIERVTWIAAALWLATQPPSPQALFGWLAISKAMGLATSLGFFFRFIKPHTDPARPEAKSQRLLAKEALPFGLNLGFGNSLRMVDVLYLARWAGDVAVGHYRAVGILILPFTLIADALINSLFPRMCAAAQVSPEAVRNYGAAASRILLRVSIPASLFLMLYSREIVTLLYGAEYLPAATFLSILALCIPVRFLCNALGTVLTASNRQAQRMTCTAIAAGFNLAINALVIPRWQALGACVTALISDLLLAFSLWIFLGAPRTQGAVSGQVALQSLLLAGLILAPLYALSVPLLPAAAALGLAYPALMLLGRARLFSPLEVQLLGRNAAS
jgi:O-antigen/teichoic acid export membrane protein